MGDISQPHSLTLRVYRVGFGDCFLLTFHYSDYDRHVLIDFGSTGQKDDGENLLVIAKDIQNQCEGKLHAVVATHRHKDHIDGFATRKQGKGPGDIIAACRPDVVVQPWTEDPNAKPDASSATVISSDSARAVNSLAQAKAFVASLQDMHAVAAAVLSEANRKSSRLGPVARRQLSFLGDDNLSNRSAVLNLDRMGEKNFYVHYGSRSGLEEVLHGVTTKVLGPPTLEQTEAIRRQRSRDKDEFWQLRSFWSLQARAAQFASQKQRLFPGAKTHALSAAPPSTRWFLKRTQSMRSDQLLSIVRALDTVLNNTSVILLFEAGGKKLLFPGDAQIENWSYALSQPGIKELLSAVDVYKVGHHGSLNATPRSLWQNFTKRSGDPSPDRLQTIVSTMAGKHGNPARGTEVPRKKLVAALERESNYFSTQELKGRGNFRKDFIIEL